jgi:hypothetical protein
LVYEKHEEVIAIILCLLASVYIVVYVVKNDDDVRE